MAQHDMQFTHTPLLPSQLLVGSPFQPGTPAVGQFSGFAMPPMTSSFQSGHSSPSASAHAAAAAAAAAAGYFYDDGHSRTVYLGNIPSDATAEEILNHVRSGVVENLKMVPEKNCAFVSFLDHSSAAHFHSDAILKKLSIRGSDTKVGWGRSFPVAGNISLAVSQDGASRNVYLGNLPDDVTEEQLRHDLSKFGPIDTIKLVRDKNIGFVHFLSIAKAIQCVVQLPSEDAKWASRKVYYGKDRCAYISKTQQQNAAQYLGIAPGYEHMIATSADRDLLSSAVAQQSAAAVAITNASGGPSNVGNRTVYLGNVHPETTIEEICNVVRGGLLHHIRYIAEKHICFVTFIDPTAAAHFYALANLQGLSIHNRRLKIGWGKHSGPLMNAIALAVSAGASRNVYIGNIDETWPESKLRKDFMEFGEIEQINFLPEKSCAFVNFTNITNAIKAIEGIKERDEYKQFKINFGKDRCGNPPRQMKLANLAPPSHDSGSAANTPGSINVDSAEPNERDETSYDNASTSGNDNDGAKAGQNTTTTSADIAGHTNSNTSSSSLSFIDASISSPPSPSFEYASASAPLSMSEEHQQLHAQLLQIQNQQQMQYAAAAAAAAAAASANSSDYAASAQHLLNFNQYLAHAQQEQYLYAAAVAAAAASRVPPPPPPLSTAAAAAAAAAAAMSNSASHHYGLHHIHHNNHRHHNQRSGEPSSASSSLTSSSYPPGGSVSDSTDTTSTTLVTSPSTSGTIVPNGKSIKEEIDDSADDSTTPTRPKEAIANGDDEGLKKLEKLEKLKMDDRAVYGLAIESNVE